MQKYKITRDKFMSKEDKRKLLKICEEKSIIDLTKGRQTWVTRYALVHLALNSGLRVSEISALKIGDLFIKGKETYLIVRSGKGKKKRDVYIDKDLVRHLSQYIDYKKKSLSQSLKEDAPLFAGRGGKHFTSTALHISFNKALSIAGLSQYSIHSARHTYATLILAKTNNLRFVQKQLGHSSLNMTSLYADVLPEMNQSLADAILD